MPAIRGSVCPSSPPLGKIDLHLVKGPAHRDHRRQRLARRAEAGQQPACGQRAAQAPARADRRPLLVRSGTGMAPTSTALSLVEPAANLLREAAAAVRPAPRLAAFRPRHQRTHLHASPPATTSTRCSCPSWWRGSAGQAPGRARGPACPVVRLRLPRSLARGEVDLVIGNWLEPPGELHLGRLFTDEIVCLVGEDHPAVRNPRGWTEARYLAAEHVAPTPTSHPA
jgi:DNA-binding transcriptional LysR family regulator